MYKDNTTVHLTKNYESALGFLGCRNTGIEHSTQFSYDISALERWSWGPPTSPPTLHATRWGQSFPKPRGGWILLSRVTTSRCLIRPLQSQPPFGLLFDWLGSMGCLVPPSDMWISSIRDWSRAHNAAGSASSDLHKNIHIEVRRSYLRAEEHTYFVLTYLASGSYSDQILLNSITLNCIDAVYGTPITF